MPDLTARFPMFLTPAASGRKKHHSTGSRNPLAQPFSSASIWNMPIGSGAVYVNSGFTALEDTYATTSFFLAPQIDPELISLDKNAPLTAIETNTVGWNGGNRCTDMGATIATVPIPASWVIPNSGDNNSAALLAADGRTIKAFQPLTRCTAGSFATALGDTGFPDEDLYGTGISGSHGGSRLSALGGSIRIGELRPGQTGMQHAIKINVDAEVYFYNATVDADTWRWPATVSDSGALSSYGSVNNNTTLAARMGMLLAIPPSVNLNAIGLESDPGRQMAWTLQNYGAYVVDSTGSGAGMALNAESGPNGSKAAEFLADYGWPMEQHVSRQSIDEGWTPPTFGAETPWSRDIRRLWVQLKIVDNNSSTTIGGGGTPRQPLAPPITP